MDRNGGRAVSRGPIAQIRDGNDLEEKTTRTSERFNKKKITTKHDASGRKGRGRGARKSSIGSGEKRCGKNKKS